ncbi:cell surface protein SprA [Neolewinella lacunae]|uniref:Cell surface protein SprA n=1 Tax=Neolewinella lacunae TaxID=1517758 RepID=A0A923PLN9_9BACT|nr:cell surface protein SprA [Neolewinella lacunae]MBC6996362.1 cell surface protein SprA [Neolewinella lacunae]MDN3636985.1 cell surface protein SprA [Neolewinella lacunae]
MKQTLLLLGFALASLSFTYVPYRTPEDAAASRKAFAHLASSPAPVPLNTEVLLAYGAIRGAAQDTLPPLQDRRGDFITDPNRNPIDLRDPSVVEKTVEYDPETGRYIVRERMGDIDFRPPTYLTFEEYLQYREKRDKDRYFQQLAGVGNPEDAISVGDPLADIELDPELLNNLFGGTEIDIQPQGGVDLSFGLNYQFQDNPFIVERFRRNTIFDFDMDIQMNVTGQIGDKLKLNTNYNTGATFNFDNQIKLDYNSEAFGEDDIIKKIEAGDVSLPLNGSLIEGAQSLFGLKTELQFGHLRLTAIASQQRSQREKLTIEGGSQLAQFEVYADDYDENRHFFLSHYNRSVYEESLENLPQINTLFNAENIEVWITNDRNEVLEVRDIVAFADLGEPERLTNPRAVNRFPTPRYREICDGEPLPENGANDLYEKLLAAGESVRDIDRSVATLQSARFGLEQIRDFEKVSARKLNPREYTLNPQLGFISLNINVQPDQVVAVSYRYKYNGEIFKVGELSVNTDNSSTDTSNFANQVLFTKMLKSSTQRVGQPTWDLMMKNVYSLGAYQVNQEDFRLDIQYEDPGEGFKRFLPVPVDNPSTPDLTYVPGLPLIRAFNLDRLNTQLDPQPDGVFDFVPGITINPTTGRIYFPVLEPFGSDLAELLRPEDRSQFVYQELYDSTIFQAREFPEKNRFAIRGSYKSSVQSEISLGAFNIPPGSVRVTAGGALLTEGQDYTVDYSTGRVRILNDAILSSGVPINVSFEDNTIFSLQTKTMLGLRADYEINDNLSVGATYLKLFERPFTQKVNLGEDPINNTIYGLDATFQKESGFLTRLVDKLPFYSTSAPSNISLTAETAWLRPGHSRAINRARGDDEGIVYLDDFEGTASPIDLMVPVQSWYLASIPQNDAQNNNPLFPEATQQGLVSGANRAQLNWFRTEPNARNPDDNNNVYTSAVPQQEVFPNVDLPITQRARNQFFSFDMAFYPNERGPYNFDDLDGYPGFTAGVTLENDNIAPVKLLNPETRWAGIMREMTTPDFQSSNIEFVEFWMLSPFLDGENPRQPAPDGDLKQGTLYINLGNVSEDILKDSRKFFENGLPGPANPNRPVDETEWSRVPVAQQITRGFDNDPETRELQDVGLDGSNDEMERQKFSDYLNRLSGGNQAGFQILQEDPANDNFYYFNNDRYQDSDDLLTRLRGWNGTEGNSAANNQTQNNTRESTTNLPDTEDINQDNTLNEAESYFQYEIPFVRSSADGRNFDQEQTPFITDRLEAPNGRVWYRFRVPLNSDQRKAIGGIQDFRSIRFMRMYMTGFRAPTILRFAEFELIRNSWRRYTRDFQGAPVIGGEENTEFNVDAVNIEENSSRLPFNYVLPNGIRREQSLGIQNTLQNEQSLSLKVQNLQPGGRRAVFKYTDTDLRVYDNLRMFVHAEPLGESRFQRPEDGELSLFIRMGSDFEANYYEYEVPLRMSDTAVINQCPPPPGNGRVENTSCYSQEVWPIANEVNLPLALLRELKLARNNQGFSSSQEFADRFRPFAGVGGEDDPIREVEHTIRVKGNPNIGFVKVFMIGVRAKNDLNNDGLSAEVWVNELRLEGLDERGGVAGLARADIQLADLGTVTAAANYSSIGFGALDNNVTERARESTAGYDLAANINLHKFFPERLGLRLPVYLQHSKTVSTPEYDPYDLDIKLKQKAESAENAAIRDSVLEQAREINKITAINFNDVGISTGGGKSPISPDNFSVSYGYTKTERSDPFIENETIKDYTGALDYSYNRGRGTPLEPFKGITSKYLKLLSEFNINPLPNSFTFANILNRSFATTKYRFADVDPQFNTFYNKRFTWDRLYDVRWDLTRSLKLGFNANMSATIDEPDESELVEQFPDPNARDDARKEAIWEGLRAGGRPKLYTQSINASYQLPLRFLPFLDFVDVRTSYLGRYTWNAAPLSLVELGLGNIIQNSQTRQVTANLNFEKFYDQFSFLRNINRPQRRTTRPGAREQRDAAEKPGATTKEDRSKKSSGPSAGARALIRPLLLLRNARFNFSEDFETVIPGFLPEPRFFGQNTGFDAPGWGFVAGFQPKIRTLDPANYGSDDDFLNNLANDGYLSPSVFQSQDVIQNFTRRWDAAVTLEPVRDFRIDLTMNRNFTENYTESFKVQEKGPDAPFLHTIPVREGALTFSNGGARSLFKQDTTDLNVLFETFESNRRLISQRLGDGTPHADPELAAQGYSFGYGPNQQDVLLPAFLAAYRGESASDVSLDPFDLKASPNWRVTYNGLDKVGRLGEVFRRVNITHGFQSTFAISSYGTSLDYLDALEQATTPQFTGLDTVTLNYFPRIEIPNVTEAKSFAPLIGIEAELQNGLSFNFTYQTQENRSINVVSKLLSENVSKEIVGGFGIVLQDVQIGFLQGNQKKRRPARTDPAAPPPPAARQGGGNSRSGGRLQVSDLDIQFNLSLRDGKTYASRLNPRIREIVEGSRVFTFAPSAEYQVNNLLSLRAFFDYRKTQPFNPLGFPQTAASGGIVVRFQLQ